VKDDIENRKYFAARTPAVHLADREEPTWDFGRKEMKDIAHRGLDSSAAGLRERGIPKRHPALYGTRVRIYAVSFSRLGARARKHRSSRTTASLSLIEDAK